MSVRSLCALTTLLAAPAVRAAPQGVADSIGGRWNAEVRLEGQSMLLTLDVRARTTGVEARISVPHERVLGLPVQSVALAGSELSFRIPHADHPMDFAGSVRGDSIDGSLSMLGDRLPLSFRRAGQIPEPPYREIAVTFEGAGRMVAGSLLLPPGDGPHAVLALFHATSTPSRDELRFYADLAARAGMAALIYDRRDVPLDIARLSRADFLAVVADAEAAVAYLRTRGDVDRARVGVGGLSQGAWIAAIVTERIPEIAFVVELSPPGVPLSDIDVYQSMQRVERAGAGADALAEARKLLIDLHTASRGDSEGTQDLRARLERARAQPWSRVLDLPERVPAPGSELLRWSAADLDPARYFERLRVPVWIAFGERDERLPAAESAARIRAALERAGNTAATLRTYPGANHALLPAPEFERELTEWIRARIAARDR